jgi:pimeloyl-ACP methyl ester carboxylesterase
MPARLPKSGDCGSARARTAPQRCLRSVVCLDQRGHGRRQRRDGYLGEQGTDCHRAARELTEDRMSRKAWKAQLELLVKVTKARLTTRQAFMANMLGNVRQLLRDLPLDQPLIDHTDEEIIALARRMFRERSAKRDSLLNRSIGRRKRKR